MSRPTSVLRVEGRDIEVSRLEKVLYPAAGFTKGDVISYYMDVAPALLPPLGKSRADDEALSRRGREILLLREELPALPAEMAAHRPRAVHKKEGR